MIIFNQLNRLKLVPTFEEFIRWLLRQPEEDDDQHWSQFHSHCSICQMRFDYILKIDSPTFEQDFNNLVSSFKNNIKTPRLEILSKSRDGSTNFNQTCIYLSQLSKPIFNQLYTRYKIDFEMFNYLPDSYASCIKS